MDSRLRGNDINCILDRHSRDSGNDAIDKAVVAATTVIPAKAGIHTACPNTNARTRRQSLHMDPAGARRRSPREDHAGTLRMRAPSFASFSSMLS